METGNLRMPLDGEETVIERPSADDMVKSKAGQRARQAKNQALSSVPASPPSSDKDREQKRLLSELLWNWGYFVQPTVKLLHPGGSDTVGRELTDVDVYGVLMTRDLHIERVSGDCKTLGRVSPINRTFWLKGVMEYLGANKGIMVLRTESEEDHKLTAKSMSITLLDDRTFEVFRDKLSGQSLPAGSHLSDPDSWQYLDGNIPDRNELEGLLQYRRFRFWRDASNRAARYSLMETRSVRSHLKPDQRHHVALVGDMVTLFSLSLQGMVCELFPLYLVVDDKAALDSYLRNYLYGGRDSYGVMNSLYQQVVRLNRITSNAAPTGTAESEGLTLPEWPSFLQLFRAILEHPNRMKDVPRFLRWIVVDRILYPDSRTKPEEAIPEIDTLTIKLALQIADYFCKASAIEPKITQQLDTYVGDAILEIADRRASS